MARLKRYHTLGAFYHVMLRGNNGQDIFVSQADRYSLCFLIQEGVERYGHRVHAFCFMNNHIHLLIQVAEIPLSKIMHNLAFRYCQRMNRKNKKVGHLFQGRFKAVLIEDGKYFKRLLRYIHLNPVRANIVTVPENYRWSSHNAYLGMNMITWLTADYGLLKFGRTIEEARAWYTAFLSKVETPEELEELRSNFKDGQVLGEDSFLDEIRSKNDMLNERKLNLEHIVEAVCQQLQVDKELMFSSSKSELASFARGIVSNIAKKERISLEKVASMMNRDGSTISSLITRFSQRFANCTETTDLIETTTKKAKQIAELQA